MKIHKEIKPEMAVSKDKSRTAIREPYLDIKDGIAQLVVTDGKIMAVVPVEFTADDVSGYVSAAVLKAARKLTRETCDIKANGVATLLDGSTMPRAGESEAQAFPNWRQVFPSENKPVITVAVDALRLWQLAQALGCQCVTLAIEAPDKPFLVTPANGGRYTDAAKPVCDGARGIIMPVVLPAKETA